MAGLDPAIFFRLYLASNRMREEDDRVKPGHDG
jgi:hypothetical protein